MNARLGTGALDMPAYPCYETDRVFKVFYGQVFLGALFRVWF